MQILTKNCGSNSYSHLDEESFCGLCKFAQIFVKLLHPQAEFWGYWNTNSMPNFEWWNHIGIIAPITLRSLKYCWKWRFLFQMKSGVFTLRPYSQVWCAQVCDWTHNQGAHRLAPPQLKPLIYFAKTHLCHAPPASSYPQVALCPPDQNQSVMGSRTIVLASSRNLNRFPLWPVVWHDRKVQSNCLHTSTK
jgi:hypothetical protein